MKIDFAQELNAQQRAVVEAGPGPILVVAGAGSGKTRALTCRLAHLVESGISPRNILLMTFTNRAAREMLARVEQLLAADMAGLWGGTFHHVGNRILRRFGDRVGLAPGFTIVDREDAKRLMRGCAAASGQAEKKRRFPNPGTLLAISGLAQNTLSPLEQILAERFPMFAREQSGIEEVLELYRERKTEANVVDFDDLLTGFHRVLKEDADAQAFLSDRFRHILVDEYQDTNRVQSEIVDRLAASHRSLCVVGDDAQAIYSFRGASFENIIGFQKRYPEALVFRLETNYRSVPPVLALANANIANNRRRWPKRLTSVRKRGELPVLTVCRDGGDQAAQLVGRVEHCLRHGVAAEEIAVLYRSHYHSMEIQLELQRRDIPFQVRGGLRFFEQAHVKDAVAFLRVSHNPRDRASWMRLLTMFPGIGERTGQRFCDRLSESAEPLATAFSQSALAWLPSKARAGFAEFAEVMVRAVREQAGPADFLSIVIEGFYGDYMLSNYSSPQRRREDLRGVLSFAGRYGDSGEFLSEIALAAEYYAGAGGGRPSTGAAEAGAIVLSTIHQAKGLEWSVVLLPWLVETRFPAVQSLESDEDIEEERRIFHVALTRAADRLFLYVPAIQAGGRNQWVKPLRPSRFLAELPDRLWRVAQAEAGTPQATDRRPSASNEVWIDDLPEIFQDA